MKTIVPVFDYASLDAETSIRVQQHTDEIKALGRKLAQDIFDLGGKFAEVRDLLRHNKKGGFEGWLDAEGFKKQFVYNCIGVYETNVNSPNFGQLDIAVSALYVLAAPSTPPSARDEAMERAGSGEKITVAKAKDIVRGNQPPITPVTKTLPTQPVSSTVTGVPINNLHLLKPGDTVKTPDGMGKVVSLRGEGHQTSYAVRFKEDKRLQRYKHDQLEFVPTPPVTVPKTAPTPEWKQRFEIARSTAPIRSSDFEDGYVPDVPEVEVDAPDERPAGMVYTLPTTYEELTKANGTGRVLRPYPGGALFRLRLYHDGLAKAFSDADVTDVLTWLNAVQVSRPELEEAVKT